MKNWSKEELIDKLKKVNTKLNESEELKSHFLSNIRNEINNPMMAILGLSNRLMQPLETDAKPEEVQSIARHIFQEAFQLDFQLKNIFTAADLEAGEVEPWVSHFDLGELVEETRDYFEHLLKEKNIQIHIHIPPALKIYQDADKLRLILINLFSNAIKFSEPHSKIELSIQTDAGQEQIHFQVKDEGIGISPEDQEKIFDRFSRLNHDPSKIYPGHGLGLCIVQALLEILGGDLDLQNQPQGGCIFSVHLPLIEQKDSTQENFSWGGDALLFDDEVQDL